MAFYEHFENKAEVLQAAADQVWGETLTTVRPHDDPVEEIVQALLTVCSAFHDHAGVTPYAVASPSTEDAVHLMATLMSARLEDAGFRDDQAGRAYHALVTYALGRAMLHAQRLVMDRSIRFPASDVGSTAPPAGDDHHAAPASYRSVRQAFAPDPDLTRFEQGLRDIMGGLLTTCT